MTDLNIPENWEDLFNDDLVDNQIMKKEEEKIKIKEFQKPDKNEHKQLKTPICCVLGHVDAGKTSFLDALRGTRTKEVSNITQIIGGTNILKSEIKCYFEKFKTKKAFDITIPGILLIDTPGHESFVSLRKLGSNLCDIAIVIVDITKGPEKQTIESLELLEKSKIPFLIALNKIDTLYKWNSTPDCPLALTKKKQSKNTLNQLDELIKQNFVQFACSGINAKLYTKIKSFKEWHPMIPISAKTKEGFSDLIAVLVKMSEKFLDYINEKEEVTGIVIEKYSDVQGVGSTIDVILTQGQLKKYDTVYFQGQKTKIKNITAYDHLTRKKVRYKYVNAAFCCTLYGTNIQDVVPGTYFSSKKGFNKEKIILQEDVDQIITCTEDNKSGIFIHADSIGSLLALSFILKKHKVLVKNYAIGTIRNKHLLYVQKFCKPKIILGFNVSIDSRCNNMLVKEITICLENIVFKLIDHYHKFVKEYKQIIKKELIKNIVLPCILSIEKNCIFRQKDPLIFGVKIKKGNLHLGTKLSIFNYKNDPEKTRVEVNIGIVTSIRDTNDQNIDIGEQGKVVVIKVEGESYISFGRHLTENNTLYSRINRYSLDIIKEHFKEEITQDYLKLLIKLKKIFNIT